MSKSKKDTAREVRRLIRRQGIDAGLFVYVYQEPGTTDGRLGIAGYSTDPRAEAILKPIAQGIQRFLVDPQANLEGGIVGEDDEPDDKTDEYAAKH